MPPSKPHYRAFISYSHRDAKWAKWLHRSLERYVVPVEAFAESKKLEVDGTEKSRRLTPVFRDRDELPASGSLGDTIQQALESSENLIVLCSPNAAASKYVNAEIEIFRGLHPDNEKKIYAVIIEGEPPECFPPALIAGGAEPIAADAREIGDGKGDAKLKLIAGMLGVGFDRLKRREAKRQRNRLLTMVSVVAVMTSVLALWALKAENEANKQRELAERGQLETREALTREEAQRILAEQAAAEAKAVLGFINTNVIGAAKPGGLEIDTTISEALDIAAPKIGKTFSHQPLIEASIRAAFGRAYNYRDNSSAAVAQLERALELRKLELGSEYPGNIRLMEILTYTYRALSRKAEAQAVAEEAVELAKKLYGSEGPTTLQARFVLADFYSGEKRIKEFEEILRLRKKILGPKHWSTLHSMTQLATYYSLAGRHQEALPLHEKAVGLTKMKYGSGSGSTVPSLYGLSASYGEAKRYEEAITVIEEILPLREKIWGAEHPATLNTMRDLAAVYANAGRNEESLEMQEKVLRLRKKVLGLQHQSTTQSMHELARSYQGAGRLEDAERQYQEFFAAHKTPESKDWVFYHDQAQLGEVLMKLKKYAEAEVLLLSAQEKLVGENDRGEVENLTTLAAGNLVKLYHAWSKPEKAAEWQIKLEELLDER